MSWCDKLASVPAVGFMLDHHYAPGEMLIGALGPILDKHVEKDKPTFSIERQETFLVVFNTNDGFKYGLEPNKVHVSFNHRMRPKAISGGPPIMEMLSKPQPFTELLPQVTDRLIEATLLLPSPGGRSLTRAGLVSTTPVDADELPPGITRMIDYIGKPWGKLAGGFNIQISADIGSGNGYSDRCVHTLARTDDTTDLMTIMFDYQRTFSNGKALTRKSLMEVSSDVEKAALRYFEELAEGNRFDEIDVTDEART